LRALVTIGRKGALEFEYTESAMPEYQRVNDPEFFAIRFGDGKLFASSKSLRGFDPPMVPSENHAIDLPLPGGGHARAARLEFVPQPEGDHAEGKGPAWAGPPMSVTVGRDRSPLDAALNRFLRTLIVAAGLLAFALGFTVAAVVRISLRSLRAIKACAEQINPSELHRRLPQEHLPAELVPICVCLNDLLNRLDAAFARERQFNANVAHELRTPIAELRAVTDVALKYPDDPSLARDACRDARDIAQQMQTLVTTLQALVRSEQTSPVACRPVSLARAALRSSEDSEGKAADVEVEIPADAVVDADPTLLESALRNIISNAVEYRTHGTHVRCAADRRGGQWALTVENHTDELSLDDLPHLHEPFWRKSAARTDRSHSGLGLSLVYAYCRLMHVQVHSALSDSMFSFQLTFPQSQSSPSVDAARDAFPRTSVVIARSSLP